MGLGQKNTNAIYQLGQKVSQERQLRLGHKVASSLSGGAPAIQAAPYVASYQGLRQGDTGGALDVARGSMRDPIRYNSQIRRSANNELTKN